MASHYIGLTRGVEGTKETDFAQGTIAATDYDTDVDPVAGLISLHVDDAGGFTRGDVIRALKAFERFFETAPWVKTAGFDVSL